MTGTKAPVVFVHGLWLHEVSSCRTRPAAGTYRQPGTTGRPHATGSWRPLTACFLLGESGGTG
jgi:hypothetical protein